MEGLRFVWGRNVALHATAQGADRSRGGAWRVGECRRWRAIWWERSYSKCWRTGCRRFPKPQRRLLEDRGQAHHLRAPLQPGDCARPFHRGGPIWPDWKSDGIERHWVGTSVRDVEPEAAVPLETLDGDRFFWAGPIAPHFGYQVLDFSMRLVASCAVDPDAVFVFAYQPVKPPRPFFFGILDWLGIPKANVVIIDKPTRFSALRVLPQPERRPSEGPS